MSCLRQVTKHEKLYVPVALVKEWQSHPLAKDFQLWLDEFLAAGYEIVDPNETPAEETKDDVQGQTQNKRKREGESAATGAKKIKIDAGLVIDAEKISGAILFEVKVTLFKDIFANLQIRAQSEVWLVNKGAKDFCGNGCQVAGYGRGSFKLLKQSEEKDASVRLLEFQLSSHEDFVFVNNQLTTVGQAVAEQRKSKPDCKVLYHDFVTEQDKGLNEFGLKVTHRVAFMPRSEESTAEASFGNVALREKDTTWIQSKALCVLWHCRWTTKGLSPVKPAVHLQGSIVLKPGQALNCHSKSG